MLCTIAAFVSTFSWQLIESPKPPPRRVACCETPRIGILHLSASQGVSGERTSNVGFGVFISSFNDVFPVNNTNMSSQTSPSGPVQCTQKSVGHIKCPCSYNSYKHGGRL
ncbi:hypothetical protein C8Q77DRAFT_848612 [Trametes polyzona]|nr:hypothetical protein C8Q77DRAFT_848612 [Trametes polyzona]